MPLFLLGHIFLGIDLHSPSTDLFVLAKWAASMLVSAGAVCLWSTLSLLLPRNHALILAAAYALGTSVWTMSSQALTNHAASLLFINWALFWVVNYILQVCVHFFHIVNDSLQYSYLVYIHAFSCVNSLDMNQ
jgi:hypothetical protein